MSLARSKGLSPDKLSCDPAYFELEKVGGAFNPMAESQRENGIQQRVLPENVYTAAIVAWLNNESASEAAIGAAFCALTGTGDACARPVLASRDVRARRPRRQASASPRQPLAGHSAACQGRSSMPSKIRMHRAFLRERAGQK